MKDAMKKADVLIEALPYIQQFRGEIVVIKFGGSAMEEKTHFNGVLADVTFMECVGMLPLIVHGGGKAISKGTKEHGIEPKFLKGLRVTCEKTIQVVQEVLNNEINPAIVATLERMGAKAQSMQGENVYTAKRKLEIDEKTGEKLDLGFVGEPEQVDIKPIKNLLYRDIIPVVTPLGRGVDGKLYNMNADTAAAARPITSSLFAMKQYANA